METTKNVYSNKEITVTYHPRKCTNAGLCAQGLSEVFRTSVIPWIDLDAAQAQKIAKQVALCPSGALQCKLHQESPQLV